MIITDSGLHIWRAETPDRPWQPGRTHMSTPDRYEDLSARMAEAGVHRAILIPPSWEGERADYSLEAVARYPDRLRSWGGLPINKQKPAGCWKPGRISPACSAWRLTFHHEWDRPWMTDGTADWFWPAAERLDIPVHAQAPTLQGEIGRSRRDTTACD